jgi:hypothetical protein
MSGSARRTGWGSGWDEEGPAPRRQHILESHLDFTPIFESEGLTIRLLLTGDLLPSKQVTRVRFPSPAPAPTRRYNACKARAAERRPPALQARCRGFDPRLPFQAE